MVGCLNDVRCINPNEKYSTYNNGMRIQGANISASNSLALADRSHCDDAMVLATICENRLFISIKCPIL
jgi:hypothetical protein